MKPRFDAAPERGHAHAVAHQIALSMTLGTAAKPRRVPNQRWPHALEAQYASKIVALVDRVRVIFSKLAREMPAALARAESQRADRMDAAADLEVRRFAGFDVVIENAAGTTRSWVDSDGTVGRTVMKFDYGYIANTLGVDDDPVDVYLGPDEESPWIYVVHQMKKSADFLVDDEDKVLIGFPSSSDAEAAYHAQYDDPRFFGGMSTFTVEAFRAALEKADGSKITHRADAGEASFARDLIDQVQRDLKRDLSKSEIDKIAQYFARETSQAQRKALSQQLTTALGVEVLPDEKHIPQLLEYFTHENATLIGSIPEQLHLDVAKLTARAFTKRMHPDTFASLLEDRFSIAENKARFIARDQLGKLWGQLNATRQVSIGVEKFEWVNCGLPNVRPSHRKVSGKIFSYDKLPPLGDSGEGLMPGEDYGCRCMAKPVLDGVLANAKELRGHRTPVGP